MVDSDCWTDTEAEDKLFIPTTTHAHYTLHINQLPDLCEKHVTAAHSLAHAQALTHALQRLAKAP